METHDLALRRAVGHTLLRGIVMFAVGSLVIVIAGRLRPHLFPDGVNGTVFCVIMLAYVVAAFAMIYWTVQPLNRLQQSLKDKLDELREDEAS